MARTRIGLSMLYCLREPFKKMTEQLAQTGTEYIEIVDEGFHALDNQRVLVLKDIGSSYGIEYSVHAPFADVNIACPSKPLLNAIFKRLEQSIVFAHALNAYAWVFHPGTETGISVFYPDMSWLQNLRTVKRLVTMAHKCGVNIAIENMPEPYPFLMKSVQDFKRFYDDVGEDIGLVLDVGHANINGQVESFLTAFADRVVHVHLSDNNGTSDQHLGVGYGTIEWEKVADLMRRTSHDKVAIIESVDHVKESLQRLRQLLG